MLFSNFAILFIALFAPNCRIAVLYPIVRYTFKTPIRQIKLQCNK